ncbi:MAG TPA: holo-ACP synthase [Anaerolineales bacterium]
MLRTGVDLIEIDRVQEVLRRHGERYLERVYTEAELAQGHNNAQYLAGRFAAKEAVAKALGTGIGMVAWQEIEVLGDDQNAPILKLSGAARKRAEELGLTEWSLSISHSMTHAVAVAVAMGEKK